MLTDFGHLMGSAGESLMETHGECIVFIDSNGAHRPIRAIVDRDPPVLMNADGTPYVVKMSIQVFNSHKIGISAEEVDARGVSRVVVTYRPGQEPQDYGVYLPPPGISRNMFSGLLTFDLR